MVVSEKALGRLMMMDFDYLYVATLTPHEEICTALNPDDPDYMDQMLIEAKTFKSLLERTYPPPIGAELMIIRCSHEYGPYLDLIAVYQPMTEAEIEIIDEHRDSETFTSDTLISARNKEAQFDWAAQIEGFRVDHWDQQAIDELRTAGYKLLAGNLKIVHKDANTKSKTA